MAQNFKRRISLFPNSFSKFQNSIKERRDSADINTLNKKIINKNTPKKEKIYIIKHNHNCLINSLF